MKAPDPREKPDSPAGTWLLIDGYSLLHRDPEFARLLKTRLELAREQLVRKIARVAANQAERVTVVFDGRQSGASDFPSGPIEVLFSPAHQTADTLIERLVHQDANPARITVVTNDRAERDTVTAAGAFAMSCAACLDEWDIREKETKRRAPAAHALPPKLGDFFPKS